MLRSTFGELIMYILDRLSLVLQFCILVVLAADVMIHMPRYKEKSGVGRLTINIERIVSDSPGYEVQAPNLYVEIEVGGVKRYTTGSNSVRDVIIDRAFVFDGVDFRGSIMLRIRDGAHSEGPCRGILAITPAEALLERYTVYRMDALNWVVMKVDWLEVKDGKESNHNTTGG